ncbi:MAG TPA: CbbQ/NirQ/NorQ/GpvN family protein [Macromonas sp.]|nr:CbbQ/NirQ/NorQ/GpvN family protein [Macromonas sp.]
MSQRPSIYLPSGNEQTIFQAAARQGLPVLLKGPTGCGKTRFVQSMAESLGRPLFTVACHEDLTAADLVGRFLLQGGETRWVDGPLTRAVRAGGICYLDEVVEARADTTVVIHPLADHRRELNIERIGETMQAPPDFMLVLSYNPGYQSVLKDLKPSTRQRMVAIELNYPTAEIERRILQQETGASPELADRLVRLGQAIRQLEGEGLAEVASTRALVSTAALVQAGVTLLDAASSAIALPLSDDPTMTRQLRALIQRYVE